MNYTLHFAFDNAGTALYTANALNNLTTPITVQIMSGDGAQFTSTPFWLDVWNTSYSTINPRADPNYEQVEVTAVNGDTLTLKRTNAMRHTGNPVMKNMQTVLYLNEIQKILQQRQRDWTPPETVNGNNTTFSFPVGKTINPNTAEIYVNGQRLIQGRDYVINTSASPNTMIFTEAPNAAFAGDGWVSADFDYL